MEIAKAYNPKEAEENHYQKWEASGFFAPEINENPDAETYSIVIPPPNVTGNLHMGHALQHTLMDTLTRWKRMQGFRTLFLVGVDHAGISTQLMVTRQLKKEEHKTPQDVGREDFIRRVWEWKEKYGGEITRQIRSEGLSVDWSRERFTMDEKLSRAVREVFVRLYEEGWIYRGTRIVNWCPRDKTVLSDLEVKEEKAKDGKLYYLQYPVKGSAEKITVATTRPETMLGDTAVAVNPEDERYAHLIGKTIELPLTGREILVIADDYVESEFGTGAVKITPAHDPNDYEIGERHGLEKLVIMNDDATMNEAAGTEFKGLDRYAARERVVERFEELGLLEKIEDYETTLPHCERCKTVIEPLLSEQWFVKMDEMRDLALGLMKEQNLPRFFPEVPHRKVYTTWLENLRDWTISRQLWWGHQIPAWYDPQGNVVVARSFEAAAEKAGTSDLVQDQDVLDTWFSSALWPFSTLGWDGETTETEDLKAFYPTSVLVTGRDILFLWVSRMVMTGMKFLGERPFDDVIIHGTVLDKNGQRMSKTKMNGIDPLDVFAKYGVDATRMTLAGSSTGADFSWRDERVESFRNFANKIWNATRFCLMNSEGAVVDPASLEIKPDAEDGIWQDVEFYYANVNLWMVARLRKTAWEVNRALNKYQFYEAVQLIYHFFWHEFCDWYIELVKDEITSTEPGLKRDRARTLIITILEQALRLLHPFMPFLTEELWQKLPGTSNSLHNNAYRSAPETIMLTDFPQGTSELTEAEHQAVADMKLVIELVSTVRNIRAETNIKPGDKIQIYVRSSGPAAHMLEKNKARILKLARADKLIAGPDVELPKLSSRGVLEGYQKLAIPIGKLIDVDKERNRLTNTRTKYVTELERVNGQLSNRNFVEKAPQEKVQELRSRALQLNQLIATTEDNLASLLEEVN